MTATPADWAAVEARLVEIRQTAAALVASTEDLLRQLDALQTAVDAMTEA
jgi:hypothetical protein